MRIEKIEFEGRTWDVDPDAMTYAQAMVITGKTGGSLKAWNAALEDPGSDGWLPGMLCLYWLMRQQDGEAVAIGSLEDVEVLKFSDALAEAIGRSSPAPEPEDPTSPGAGSGALPAAAASPRARASSAGSSQTLT